MLPKKRTIDDLARELNLSKSTVSRALQDSYQISEKTKQRVLQLAEQWGFHLNPQARGLKTRRSFTLGVVVPEIAHKYFSSAISGIQEVVLPAGYNVLIGQSNESEEQEYQVVRQLIASRVDGLIMSLSGKTHHIDFLKTLTEERFPLVMFDRVSDEVNCSKVIIDHELAAYTAVEHLIRNGCKRIAHLSGPQVLSIAKNRIKGYQRALKTYGLPFVPELVVENGTNPEYTPEHVRRLMRMTDPPDGISCFNDDVAINVLLTLKQDGIQVPSRVKVIGFNNEKDCLIIEPNLSSIEHPVVKMGKEAARLLLKQLDNENQKPQTVVFETSLIARKSTKG
ncbi:MAG: LacI family transcriptional regulator [Bacteroidales bacterium]|jgi:DNA-binding LacI/PurR family transcriptional regulator|nr:LacI family transcriptional regulator [Bacteroidales bacterium]